MRGPDVSFDFGLKNIFLLVFVFRPGLTSTGCTNKQSVYSLDLKYDNADRSGFRNALSDLLMQSDQVCDVNYIHFEWERKGSKMEGEGLVAINTTDGGIYEKDNVKDVFGDDDLEPFQLRRSDVKDFDECQPGWDGCQGGTTCENFEGGYSCTCISDFLPTQLDEFGNTISCAEEIHTTPHSAITPSEAATQLHVSNAQTSVVTTSSSSLAASQEVTTSNQPTINNILMGTENAQTTREDGRSQSDSAFTTQAQETSSPNYYDVAAAVAEFALNIAFDQKLGERESAEFRALESSLHPELESSFIGSLNFVGLAILSFREGSTICDFEVSFGTVEREEKSSPPVDLMKDLEHSLISFGEELDQMTTLAGMELKPGTFAYSVQKSKECDAEQFACLNANGLVLGCIPNEWRCDKLADCPRADDEMNCMPINKSEPNGTSLKHGHSLSLQNYSTALINHPNWPSYYKANADYVWNLSSETKTWISLWFLAFNLELGYACEFDRLEISYATSIHSMSTTKYCGMLGSQKSPPFHLIIPKNSVFLQFRTDEFTHYCGFSLLARQRAMYYVSLTCPQFQCISDIMTCIPSAWLCDGEEDCPYGEDESDCSSPEDDNIALTSCYTKSGNPGPHSTDKSKCMIETQCSRSNDTKFCFPWTSCGIDSAASNGSTCDTLEHLEIGMEDFDAKNSSVDDKFECNPGVSIPATWVCDRMVDCPHAEDEINCDLNSSNPIEELIQTGNILKSCGGYLRGDGLTVFTHAEFPDRYPTRTTCKWIIEASPDKVVRLYFVTFALPSVRGCLSDVLAVYDGPGTNHSLIGWHCRTPAHIPLYVTSTGNYMTLLFKSDCDNRGQLVLAYKGIPPPHNHNATSPFHTDCYVTAFGYRGTANTTSSGKACQRWDEQSPWAHDQLPEKLPSAGLIENYCRYPIEDWREPFSVPMCFTQDTEVPFEECGQIPKCTFAECPDPQHYQCATGECVPLAWRCDDLPDCPLADDEYNCEESWREQQVVSNASDACTINGVTRSSKILTDTRGYMGLPAGIGAETNGSYIHCKWHIAPILDGSNISNLAHLVIDFNEMNLQLKRGDYFKLVSSDGVIFETRSSNMTTRFQDLVVNATRVNVELRAHLTGAVPSELHLGYRVESCVQTILLPALCEGEGMDPNISSGSISSPGYPAEYGPDTYCVWIFKTEANTKNCQPAKYAIEFEVTDIKLEFLPKSDTGKSGDDDLDTESITCVDKLEFFDGLGASRARIVSPICGTRLPPFRIPSAGADAMVKLTSDRKILDTGALPGYGDVRTPDKPCCAYDCEMNYACSNCPEDGGYASVSYRLVMLNKTVINDATPSTATLPPDKCRDGWTRWFNEGKPSGITLTGVTLSGGEFEFIPTLRRLYDSEWGGNGELCSENKTVAIECRATNGVHWKHTGQYGLECDLIDGFVCYNRPQPGKCFDYEVRFYCICNSTAAFLKPLYEATKAGTTLPETTTGNSHSTRQEFETTRFDGGPIVLPTFPSGPSVGHTEELQTSHTEMQYPATTSMSDSTTSNIAQVFTTVPYDLKVRTEDSTTSSKLETTVLTGTADRPFAVTTRMSSTRNDKTYHATTPKENLPEEVNRGLYRNATWYWSMDSVDSSNNVAADFYDESVAGSSHFYLDPDGNVTMGEGFLGSSTHIAMGGTVDILGGVKGICLRNQADCTDGLSFVFWLKVTEWNTDDGQQIIRITPQAAKSHHLPGFYLGANASDSIYLYLASEGIKYEANLERNLVFSRFTMVGITWTEDGGIRVAINGTYLPARLVNARQGAGRETNAQSVDLKLGGSLGPEFYLDELQIYYQYIGDTEMWRIYSDTIAYKDNLLKEHFTEESSLAERDFSSPLHATSTTMASSTTTKGSSQPGLYEDSAWFWSMNYLEPDGFVAADVYDQHIEDSSHFSIDTIEVSIQEGIIGSSLHITMEGTATIINDIKRVCLHDISQCPEDGLSYVFWLKVTEWNTNDMQYIIYTTAVTTSSNRRPGFYIGADTSSFIYVYLASKDSSYEAQFDRSLVFDQFTMVAVTWTADTGLRVAVNGSFLPAILIRAKQSAGSGVDVQYTDLKVGGTLGPDFYLDELQIYYKALGDLEIQDLYFESLTAIKNTRKKRSLNGSDYDVENVDGVPTNTTSSKWMEPIGEANTTSSQWLEKMDEVNTTLLSRGQSSPTKVYHADFDNVEECVPGWTPWIEVNSSVKKNNEFATFSEQLVSSPVFTQLIMDGLFCDNPIAASCKLAGNEKPVSEIHKELKVGGNQHQFDPVYTCDVELGIKCHQVVPCHPCDDLQFRLYCPCSDDIHTDTSTASVELAVTSAQTPERPILCYHCREKEGMCLNLEGPTMSYLNCTNGACWSTSYFDGYGLKETWRGCDENQCIDKYKEEKCYYTDFLRETAVCTTCCEQELCNVHLFDNQLKFAENNGISCTCYPSALFLFLYFVTLIFS